MRTGLVGVGGARRSQLTNFEQKVSTNLQGKFQTDPKATADLEIRLRQLEGDDSITDASRVDMVRSIAERFGLGIATNGGNISLYGATREAVEALANDSGIAGITGH